jgi:mono/diheme cytochrome c family protein
MLQGRQYLVLAISGGNYSGELVAYRLPSGDGAQAPATQTQALTPRAAASSEPLYTAAQVARGRALYNQQCAVCHGPDLEGVEMAPALAGGDFMDKWTGQTIGDLFERIRGTMPKNNPGSLSREANADITAYMLSVNRFPAGSTDLPSDTQTLRRIRIEAVKLH